MKAYSVYKKGHFSTQFVIKDGNINIGSLSHKAFSFGGDKGSIGGQNWIFKHSMFSTKTTVIRDSQERLLKYTLKAGLTGQQAGVVINGSTFLFERKKNQSAFREYSWFDNSGNELMSYVIGAKGSDTKEFLKITSSGRLNQQDENLLMLAGLFVLIGQSLPDGAGA